MTGVQLQEVVQRKRQVTWQEPGFAEELKSIQTWGVAWTWGYPNSWMVYNLENPIQRMMTGGTPMTQETPHGENEVKYI